MPTIDLNLDGDGAWPDLGDLVVLECLEEVG